MRVMTTMLTALLLAGCAATSEGPPEWIDGRSAGYPEARYLTGLGQAPTAALARDRARADLIKVFEAKIAEESRESATATRESRDGKATQSSRLQAERSLSVTTARTVEGIRIAELWEDREHKSWHALAVLDRTRAGEALREEITALDDLTRRELDRARGADDLLLRIASAARATDAQGRRAALQRDLRVIDVTGVGIPPRWELARLESDRDALARRLRLSSRAEGDPVGNLDSMIAGAVARAGFTPAPADEAPYQITASLDLNESRSGGWFWAQGVLTLTLRDQGGAVRGERRFPVKASGQQPGVARQRLMGAIDRLLRARLHETVLAMAASDQ